MLAETPEIYGAEHLLTRRAVTPAVAQKLLARIDWWRDYTARNGDELNNNPSYGNKQGGLTTILEKSLGAVAKGGTMPLKAVYEYAEMVTETGFVFMDTPGYDPAAVTGQVAGGCNVICFTTGRGSVSGFKPAPCIKIATNTEMYDHMRGGHGHQLRRHRHRHRYDRGCRAADLRGHLAVASGKKTVERSLRLRRQRIRALAGRGDYLICLQPTVSAGLACPGWRRRRRGR